MTAIIAWKFVYLMLYSKVDPEFPVGYEILKMGPSRWMHAVPHGLLMLFIPVTGCQPKTFKTFILMVKPLKPLFFSEKPLFEMTNLYFQEKLFFR